MVTKEREEQELFDQAVMNDRWVKIFNYEMSVVDNTHKTKSEDYKAGYKQCLLDVMCTIRALNDDIHEVLAHDGLDLQWRDDPYRKNTPYYKLVRKENKK